LDSAQLFRHRPLSTICRQPPRLARAHVPKTWVLSRLGIGHPGLRILPGLLTATGITGIALGIATCTVPTIHCDTSSKGMHEYL